mmetsp:Transcript_5552/g.7501  ORF Transcript_5552/g.7501 Transcript_5552/m.7501 type:complete len:284 (-) Transcript_5552:292-1143(-)|eukprot:CAMPEP_0196586496 /NCGR_PEP_ID=MMETSP1081-20130531/54499_1 /TAXON_ID=36882 /ORGANISM="Pyramimonas amylifera, Strain CCMP720" /LENGTH=283 /DNA_ID=CAMNT_0041908399 /DNA_START=185 /DNA_END=1036 /DNA_ORIENTATION=+
MEFDLLFGETNFPLSENAKSIKEESCMFMYMRVLRRLSTSQEPSHRKGTEIVRKIVKSAAEENHAEPATLLISVVAELNLNQIPARCRHSAGKLTGMFSSSNHAYVEVLPGTSKPSERIIVEPFFREQFEVARPTESYLRILAALPQSFFGTQFQLSALVEFMSERMSESFREQGMGTPPWRQGGNMLTKWDLNDAHLDTNILASIPNNVHNQENIPITEFRGHAQKYFQPVKVKVSNDERVTVGFSAASKDGFLLKHFHTYAYDMENKVKGGCVFSSKARAL